LIIAVEKIQTLHGDGRKGGGLTGMEGYRKEGRKEGRKEKRDGGREEGRAFRANQTCHI
jgi:hypothetical protein